jgi:hypothetical protein
LDWDTYHVTWAQNDWVPVLFTNKSRYCLDFIDRRPGAWRRQHERFHDANIINYDHYGGGTIIMVLGGISRDGKTDVLERGPTGVRYRDEILDVYVRHYAGAVGPEFTLIDVNARPHRVRVVEQYLQQEIIVCMD